jgi:hypothetical protein
MGKIYKILMKNIKMKAKFIKNSINKVKKIFLKSHNSRNINGKKFEAKTSIETYLINTKGYEKVIYAPKLKNGYYLEKETMNYKNIYLKQHGFVHYMNKKLGILRENLCRLPDEAFMQIPKKNIKSKKINLYIVENKHKEYSKCIDILMTGNEFKIEYNNALGSKFKIEYCYVLNDRFFKNLHIKNFKNNNLRNRLHSNNIPIFNGGIKKYKQLMYNWLNKVN